MQRKEKVKKKINNEKTTLFYLCYLKVHQLQLTPGKQPVNSLNPQIPEIPLKTPITA